MSAKTEEFYLVVSDQKSLASYVFCYQQVMFVLSFSKNLSTKQKWWTNWHTNQNTPLPFVAGIWGNDVVIFKANNLLLLLVHLDWVEATCCMNLEHGSNWRICFCEMPCLCYHLFNSVHQGLKIVSNISYNSNLWFRVQNFCLLVVFPHFSICSTLL